VPSLRRYARTMHGEKRFVFLLQRFSLVVQAREYIRVRGFHLVFCLRFWIFCWLFFPVPFALYLQQFGTRTCHFAWYLQHFGMVTLHFAWYLHVFATFGHVCLPFCMVFVTCWHFNLSFAWYLLHFGASNVHVGPLKVL